MCKEESKKHCDTVYEEKCEVTYSYGKKCTKVPKEECKYVKVKITYLELNPIKDIPFIRKRSVKKCPLKSVKMDT